MPPMVQKHCRNRGHLLYGSDVVACMLRSEGFRQPAHVKVRPQPPGRVALATA